MLILDSDNMTWIPHKSFSGMAPDVASSAPLFMGTGVPATHCLVELRRGALSDWAQTSIGLIRLHSLLNQSPGSGHDAGATGRVKSPANHMAEDEGETISWREFEILPRSKRNTWWAANAGVLYRPCIPLVFLSVFSFLSCEEPFLTAFHTCGNQSIVLK